MKKAVRKVFGATWQRCAVHYMRNALANVPAKQRGMVAAAIRTAFAQETEKDAIAEWSAVADRLRERFSRVSALLEEAPDEVLAYMTFHKSHWNQIRSTNPLERINREIKRRTNVASIFPNEAAIVRVNALPASIRIRNYSVSEVAFNPARYREPAPCSSE